MSDGITYAELVALQTRIREQAGIYLETHVLEQLAGNRVRERRHGVTPAGMPWQG